MRLFTWRRLAHSAPLGSAVCTGPLLTAERVFAASEAAIYGRQTARLTRGERAACCGGLRPALTLGYTESRDSAARRKQTVRLRRNATSEKPIETIPKD